VAIIVPGKFFLASFKFINKASMLRSYVLSTFCFFNPQMNIIWEENSNVRHDYGSLLAEFWSEYKTRSEKIMEEFFVVDEMAN
jgi:hypothetical protein